MSASSENSLLHQCVHRPTVRASGSCCWWGLGHATRDSSVEGGRGVVAGRKVGAFAVCAVLLVACGSEGDAGPGTTTPSFVETTTTSAPSVSTSTTTTPTSTPDATTAPPTTIDPAVAAEIEARAAVDRAIADFSSCLAALPNCDPTTLAVSSANPILATNAGRVSEWNLAGYTVIDRDQFRYVIESVDLADDQQRATVTVCFADGSKLIDPGAGPNGTDLVVDGTYTSGREAWDVRRDADGVWRAYDAPAVGDMEGTDVCPPA